jgi:metal-responsive CopG/Arc/MetJ family transcriptional regulator
MEAERAEKLEAEIDSLIERRAREERDAGPIEEAWRETTRRHNEQRREELGAAWYGYHEHMKEVHSMLARQHEIEALKLLEPGNLR